MNAEIVVDHLTVCRADLTEKAEMSGSGGLGFGLGGGSSGTSVMGIVKQQQSDRLWDLGLGLVIFFFSPQLLAAVETSAAAGLLECFCVTSSSPRRSASVSMLVRSSSIGYRDSSLGSSTRRLLRRRRGGVEGADDPSEPAANGRRHARPLDVMPRQVVEGFLESLRARRDSGVLGMNGIARRDFRAWTQGQSVAGNGKARYRFGLNPI
ncbi:hypothetical protein PspLS_05925 [Pyricularia sp. CBS 133598]|nr:hypothetical protein PspLS_05925 [Pyricularia sp. CBS 133598]